MEGILLLYILFTGLVYTSWMWDSTDSFLIKILIILFGFTQGWLITPIIIGKALSQIYKS